MVCNLITQGIFLFAANKSLKTHFVFMDKIVILL